MRTCFRCLGVLALFSLAPAAWAEERIPLSAVPQKVLAAVRTRFPGAEISGAEKEMEEGKVRYEINLKHKGQKIDAEFSPEGEFLEMEAVIDVKDLPRAVGDAIAGRYAGSTLKRAEKVTKKDDSVLYEVVIQSGDRTGEVVVDPHGKILKGLQADKRD
jgi:uncharacterized membrane protein YkoI